MQLEINYKFIKKNLPFSFLSSILIFILIYSFFHPIPTESGVDYGVGVGSKLLNIGDRFFYHRNRKVHSSDANSFDLKERIYI